MKCTCMDFGIIVLCVCGVAISYYAIHIARAKQSDSHYHPSCDLDETISCSRALLSEYSKGLGIVGKILGEDHFLNIPNSYLGLVFFNLILALALSTSLEMLQVALFITLVSTIISAYLLYVLVFVLEIICIVCLPVHLINVFLFVLFTLKWRTVTLDQSRERKTK